ncbi:acetylglutamate kinase [Halobacteriales archaeon QS_9_70_65]|nr:MAG: acetylglutamate kinase [Halobacteriales archaeon QS_9_70_65]
MTAAAPVVVKIGGARAVDPEGVLADVAAVRDDGTDVVVVHGGSTAVDDTLERMGMEPEYVETPSGVVGRFTDAETMDVFTMAMAGRVNTDLVVGLRAEGVDAVGLSGVDLADEGVAVNTDADRAAAAVAAELGARLVSLTDVAGVYRDPDAPATVIDRVETPAEYEVLTEAAEGFMSRKVMAAEEALAGGASEVVVADANADEPVRSALSGGGTHVLPGALGGEQ